MQPIPQRLIANYSIRGLAVPRAGDKSYVTGSIHGWSQSHLTYILYRVAAKCELKERKLPSQSPSVIVNFSVHSNLKIRSGYLYGPYKRALCFFYHPFALFPTVPRARRSNKINQREKCYGPIKKAPSLKITSVIYLFCLLQSVA